LSLLDPMINHFEKNPDSLISKIYGIYSVKTRQYARMDFIVMENVTRNITKDNFKVSFDLKGSTRNRKVNVK
jgi:hypothetical protein